LRFGVLNACSSTQKGADLLVQTLDELSRRALDERFRLLVHGSVAPHVEAPLRAHPSVELRGHYRTHDLDRLLREVDVGLFPSVWEEVYGFVALEFLAAGIPVIGNAVGAIPEHVRPGETGWLNRSCSAAELADLISAAIERPDEVEQLSRSTVGLRDEIIEPFAAGLDRLTGVYARVGAP
jgi:glycosyltransferase involved in cell wall biosynthesis